jgi:excisionase family DNA binding protein
MDYYTITQAAKYLSVTPQHVYKQIRRRVIKAVIIKGNLLTTQDWLDEYHAHKYSKSEHATFNGRLAFSEEKGEYSVGMCAQKLGVDRQFILSRIQRGSLKAYRRGVYYLILKADFEEFVAALEKKDRQLTFLRRWG